MKRLSLLLTLVLVNILLACNNTNNTSNSATGSDSVAANVDTSGASSEGKDDANEFITEAVSGGAMEVELGKIAQKNALDTEVKKYAAMMVTDHTKAGEELKSLAAAKNITLPADPLAEHKEHIAKLKEKTGVEFDKAYLKMMLKDHKDVIDDFEDAAEDNKDADIKAFAEKTLPVLKTHLSTAKKINKRVKASLDPNDLSDGVETFPQR